MKHLLTTFIAMLTCATLHAQTVIVKGTSAGAVRGTIEQTVSSVLTNLAVTGTLNPDATGTNYVNVGDYFGYDQWSNSVNGYDIRAGGDPKKYYIAKGVAATLWINTNEAPIVIGTFTPVTGAVTGTATVVYWYQTNFASTVSVKGTATP